MSSGNGVSKLVVGVCISGMVALILGLFNSANQRASQAFETSVQNRERISVVESQFNEIKTRIEEQREDSKEIKKSLDEMKIDIQTLINR